jgi:hypothetical protein
MGPTYFITLPLLMMVNKRQFMQTCWSTPCTICNRLIIHFHCLMSVGHNILCQVISKIFVRKDHAEFLSYCFVSKTSITFPVAMVHTLSLLPRRFFVFLYHILWNIRISAMPGAWVLGSSTCHLKYSGLTNNRIRYNWRIKTNINSPQTRKSGKRKLTITNWFIVKFNKEKDSVKS